MAKQFEVLVSRSAVETATLLVMAESQDQAEEIVGSELDRPERVGLTDIIKNTSIILATLECGGDDESSWEIA